MADFYPAAQQIQNPDILGAYVRGQMAPLQISATQQENTQRGLQIDQLKIALQNQKMYQRMAGQLMGQSGGAQDMGGRSGGVQNGPQDQVSHQSPGNPTQSGSFDGSVSGYQPSTLAALAILRGDDPLKTMQGAQEYALKQRQLQAQAPLALLDSIEGSASPGRIVMNNPGLMQRWQQLAPQMGFDPVKDFSDDNVRAVVGFARNQVAGAAGLPTKESKPPLQTSQGPLGSVYQTDPITHRITQVKGEESLHPVIGPNGQPTLVTAPDAVGKQPFNQSLFGASSLGDQAKEFAYQQFVATGKLASNFGRNPAMQASLMDYIAKRAGQEGNSAASIAAKGQAFTASQGVVKDFTSGQSSKSVNAINTAVAHIDSLTPLVDALGTGDIKQVNRFTNAFKEQTGLPAPTNYAALKEFVGGEVAKAVLPGGGGEKEREALLAPLNAANSPQAIHEALGTIQTALAGKTEALKNTWDVGTMGTQGDFNKFLLPATKKALGIQDTKSATSAHPPDIQALLNKYK